MAHVSTRNRRSSVFAASMRGMENALLRPADPKFAENIKERFEWFQKLDPETKEAISVIRDIQFDEKAQNKNYCCHLCDKTYDAKSSLVRHVNCHKNGQALKCDVEHCTSSFNRSDKLLRHKRNVHKLGNYTCGTCNGTFMSQQALKNHKCGGKQSLFCSVCSAA